MSSNYEEYEVVMVRIVRSESIEIQTYKDKTSIVITDGIKGPLKYFRLKHDGLIIFLRTFDQLEWVNESSMDGVAVIQSFSTKVIITYDKKNQSLVKFFNDLQKSLTHDSSSQKLTTNDTVSWQSKSDQLNSKMNHLIQMINSGALDKIDQTIERLVQLQANVGFKLISKDDNQQNNDSQNSKDSIFRLLLRIEYAWGKDPITIPLDILSGTTLESLKQRIEKDTGIRSDDQHWFAFNRYPISNEYIFESSSSIISSRIKHGALTKPILSGDMVTMSREAKQLKIKDNSNPSNVETYQGVRLQLSKRQGIPGIVFIRSTNNETICTLQANDCTYIDKSSQPNVIECFHIPSTNKILMIMGLGEGCYDLLTDIHNYLDNNTTTSTSSAPQRQDPYREPEPNQERKSQPKPTQNAKVGDLIRALNEQDADKAGKLARELANQGESIGFALDMMNESGNEPPRVPPEPVIEPLKLKLSIESFLIDTCPTQPFDVAILPGVELKELKQRVTQQAGIEAGQQYWYINRDLLEDQYKFGQSNRPAVIDGQTVLTLYIAKPN